MEIQVRKKKTIDGKEVIQITTLSERWYQKGDLFVPSVTWIASYYPAGIGFYKWLAERSWDESEAIKIAAGDKGSKVHKAIEDLMMGKELKIDDKYLNHSKNEPEELTVQEWECIMSFADWYNKVKPKIKGFEQVIFDEEYNYAGTVDLVAEINGVDTLIDIKTSQSIWPAHELQVSAYAHTLKLPARAILQVGYRMNKTKYKYTEIDDKFDLFLAAKKIWENEAGKQQPKQKDYPTIIKL